MRGFLILLGAVAIGLLILHYVAPAHIPAVALYIALAAWIDRKVKP